MGRISPNWQLLPEKYKWVVRVGMLLLAVGNGWEWHRHTAAHNPTVAVIDALFVAAHNPTVAVIDALFVALCLWFILQSFQNR